MTNTQTATYKAALKEARAAFDKAQEGLWEAQIQVVNLTDELSRLRRTITALAALCSEEPGLDDLGITESCMEVMEYQREAVTTADVVSALELMGFDIKAQKNASASVHAVLTRLAKRGKISREETEGGVVRWKGPNYVAPSPGPEITDEDIPF